ncbi:MAG: response regulator [Candidatus Omnitrophica bacterium]|nr:response regulator [Candidatus Omnitrophota bacterium]
MVDEQKAQILVVDDKVELAGMMEQALTARGYKVQKAYSAEEALKIINSDIHLVISDIMMPGVNGIQLLRLIKEKQPLTEVVMMTGYATLDDAITCMKEGAYDFIVKPFTLNTAGYVAQRALEKRELVIKNMNYQANLEKEVKIRTEELVKKNEEIKNLYLRAIRALAYSLEAKDKYTENHSRRVTSNALEVAVQMTLSDRQRENIEVAGLLHDIGKIGIRESVLTKPGSLTPEEYEHIKEHPILAERILSPIKELKDVIKIIRHHHERFDGKGYPDGLKGEEIPLESRILAVCDTYDAMTSNRSYRKAFSREDTIKEIKKMSGSQFDPQIVQSWIVSALQKQE